MQRMRDATVKVAGFSLVELMLSVALFGVLLSIALPSYTYMVNDRYADNAAAQVYAILSYTRQQAVVLKKQVVLCGVNEQLDDCVSYQRHKSSNWSNGVMVFVDLNQNEKFDAATETPLKIADFIGQPLSINSSTGSFIAYKRTGAVQGFSNGTLTFSSGDHVKELIITNFGRVRYVDQTN